MSNNAIELRGVSKQYYLGQHLGSGRQFREVVTNYVTHRGRPPVTELWALQDVTFDMEVGAAMGVIGRNGAGKSTLLKIITRITDPTSGTSRTRGRVGSLLEVGIGFHPELTGRENVYLNGAVLGMSRRQVSQRFEEIVEFAGVPRFIDTPVKRYSTGMHMRLAFAVAAHLDVEILVVDEVLAVGDAEFQRKCLGKMSEIERSGRTVVFVSHNLGAVRRLCPESIWLEGGRVKAIGPTPAIMDAYLASGSPRRGRTSYPPVPGPVSLREVAVLDATGVPSDALPRAEAFTLEVAFEVRDVVSGLDLGAVLGDVHGHKIMDVAWSESREEEVARPGRYVARLTIPPVLNVGDYNISLWLGTPYEDYIWEEYALMFRLDGDTEDRRDRMLDLGIRWVAGRVDDRMSATSTGREPVK